jgi:hypothetical protein
MAIVIPIISEYNAKGVNKAMQDIKKAGSTFDKFSVGIGAASKVAAVGLAGFSAVAFRAVTSAEDAAAANAALNNVLTSMGYPQATKRVSEYAESLEKSLAVDADIIKATQTKLATFAELNKTVDEAGGAFDRATLAALDMAAAGFGSAEGNAVQLGKALNDPIKGINALTKSGITFTEQEKEQIKTMVESGNTLKAQDMILKAIEKQVSGTAQATAKGSDKMKLGFAAITDAIGLALMPAFESLTALVLKFTPLIEQNGAVIGKVILVFGAFAAAIIALNYAIKAYIVITKIAKAVTVAWTAVQKALNIALISNPIGLIVLAIAAFIAAIVIAYKKSDSFRSLVNQLFDVLKQIGAFIKNVLVGYFNLWVKAIEKVVSWIQKLADKLNPLKNALSTLNPFTRGALPSATVSGQIAPMGSRAAADQTAKTSATGALIMDDEMIARGIARILMRSDLRNGRTIGYA